MKHYLISIIILAAAYLSMPVAAAQGENDTLWTKLIDGINEVKFSPDGKNIAFSRQNGEIYIVNSANGDSIYKFSQPGGYYLDYSPDGKYLVTTGIIDEKTSDTELIRVLDIKSRSLSRYLLDTLKSKVEGLITARTIAYSNDGKYIAVGFWAESDGFRKSWVVVWETLNFTTVTYNYYPQSSIIKIRFSPDSRKLAISLRGKSEGYVLFIDVNTWDSGPSMIHPDGVKDFTLTGDGTKLITGCDDGNIRIWNTETKELERIIKEEGDIRSLGISKDNQFLFYEWGGAIKNGLYKKDQHTEEVLYKYNEDIFPISRNSLNSIDISPNESIFVGGSSLGVCVYKADLLSEVNENKQVNEILFPNPATGIVKIAFLNPEYQFLKIIINNLSGSMEEIIFKGNMMEGLQEIKYNTLGLSAGTYFIQISNSTFSKTFKLVKE